MKKELCVFLSAMLVMSSLGVSESAMKSFGTAKTENEHIVYGAETNAYGLPDNIQDGVILHCFDWKYNDIKAELPNIAAAGFTSVQTSPAQKGVNSGIWYWLYQPLGFSVATNDLGTREELASLCAEADKYGIKVIVDVVANHLAGDHTNIQSDLKDGKYWHTYGSIDNYSNRTAVTTGNLGMQDIKSEDSYVQQLVRNYVLDLKSLGVDGIRWDAAKHIALPSEGCNFWPAVCNDTGLYHYGEILGNPGASTTSGNNTLMSEYVQYMSVTDSSYGQTFREAFNSGTAPTSYGNWTTRGISAKNLVYWAESHDTWSNDKDSGYSNEMSQNVIDRAYAMAASRQYATALYLSRPSSAVKTNIYAGVKGSTHFTSREVAAVNHFHNAMIGQSEYFVSSNNVAAVCRNKGVVIAMGSGSGNISIPNGGSLVEPGTYTDEITGNTFTVTSSTITGTVGSTGIAVVYDWKDEVPTTTTTTTKTYTTYLNLPAGWNTPVYCYVYDKASGANNAGWPGVAMTYDSVTGYYKYQVPSEITQPRVIFYSSDENRHPADQQEGLAMTDSNMLYDNGTWKAFDPKEVVTTTQKQTTTTSEKQTTATREKMPIEVVGEIISSDSDNTISVVWGQNEEQINNGQKYNVYLDGVPLYKEVICKQYVIENVPAGDHEVRITALLNGIETAGVTKTVTVSGKGSEYVIKDGIEVNGYQISANVKGFRTVYSVEPQIDQKNVEEAGLVYALSDYVNDDEIVVGSDNRFVRSFAGTEAGKIKAHHSESASADSYAMTMKFSVFNTKEYTANMAVRAYAKLEDGTVVYTDVYHYSIFQVADTVYRDKDMSTKEGHDYLYEEILKVVEPDYKEVEYVDNDYIQA